MGKNSCTDDAVISRNNFKYIYERCDMKSRQKNIYKTFKNLLGKTITLEVVRNDNFLGGIQEFCLHSTFFNLKRFVISTFMFYFLLMFYRVYEEPCTRLAVLSGILSLCVLLKWSFTVKKETLMIISSIGIQISTTFVTGRKSTKLFSSSSLQDIAINEYISMHCVVYCLILLLETSSEKCELYPLFQGTKPRLDCIQEIYSRTKHYLHGKDVSNHKYKLKDYT